MGTGGGVMTVMELSSLVSGLFSEPLLGGLEAEPANSVTAFPAGFMIGRVNRGR